MLPFFRALRFLPAFLLVFGFHLHAQGMPVRVEAIHLLERANAVSRPAHIMPNHRQDVTFRAYGLDGTTQDGKFNGIYSGDSERYETVFSSYHAISPHFPDRIVQNDYQPPPPETLELDALTPLLIGQFDKSDTIYSITPATLFGRRAKCIHLLLLDLHAQLAVDVVANVGRQQDALEGGILGVLNEVFRHVPTDYGAKFLIHADFVGLMSSSVHDNRLGRSNTAEPGHPSSMPTIPASHHSVHDTTSRSRSRTLV